MSVLLNIIIFVFILGLIVLIHEFGHFIFAKRAGILCREFAIGMGPKIWSKKIGETAYSIRLLPIGGYVAMAGEDGDDIGVNTDTEVAIELNDSGQITHFHLDEYDERVASEQAIVVKTKTLDLSGNMSFTGIVVKNSTDMQEQTLTQWPVSDCVYLVEKGDVLQLAPENRRFGGKTPWQKFLTIFAGPAMNFILALLLLFAIFAIGGTPVNDPILGEIVASSPAERAGLQKGDEVIRFGGESVESYQEIAELAQQKPGEIVEIEYVRDGENHVVEAKIDSVDREVMNEDGDVVTQTVGQLGVYRSMSHNPFLVIQSSFEGLYQDVMSLFQSLSMLVSGAAGVSDLSGPIGIAVMTSKVTESAGVMGLLRWTAFLSVNIGFLNLLPLPALDGGRLVFVFYEAITKKKANAKFEFYLNLVGIVLLFSLIIYVTFNDILRLL
ncbi:MAG: RIP metalloprotease RseP [Culicoidibacterales bacterium]